MEIIISLWLESGEEIYKIILKLLGGGFFFFPHFKIYIYTYCVNMGKKKKINKKESPHMLPYGFR